MTVRTNALVIGLPRLHHLALTAWHRTLATTTHTNRKDHQ